MIKPWECREISQDFVRHFELRRLVNNQRAEYDYDS